MKALIMHYDLPRDNWHAKYVRDFTYKYLPEYGIEYKIVYHSEPWSDDNEFDLIDISEWCNPWHEEVALTYSIPIICSTEEGSLNPLKGYLQRNNINVPLMLSRINHFVARTSWTKEEVLMKFGINPQKISVIPYGTDLNTFKSSNKEPKEPAFLYVGSINKQKGVHHLITSYLQIMNETDWKLKLCVGEFNNDDTLLSEIKKLAEQYKKIQLIPFPALNQLPRVYHESSCFVLPQDWGSVLQFGYPLVWAISCGLPAISLDQGAARDFIRNGENGFSCMNTKEISKRMLEMTQLNYKEMGKVSRQIAEQRYNPDIIAKKYKEVYIETVKNAS